MKSLNIAAEYLIETVNKHIVQITDDVIVLGWNNGSLSDGPKLHLIDDRDKWLDDHNATYQIGWDTETSKPVIIFDDKEIAILYSLRWL